MLFDCGTVGDIMLCFGDRLRERLGVGRIDGRGDRLGNRLGDRVTTVGHSCNRYISFARVALVFELREPRE